MSVLSYTDIFPDQSTTDQIVDQQHTPVVECQQQVTLLERIENFMYVQLRVTIRQIV